MKLFLATALLVLLPSPTDGQACSFTKSFGSGSALSTSGVESFNAARSSTTKCELKCDGGAATTLALQFDEAPTIFSSDGSTFIATGCSGTVSISSSSDEYRLGYSVNSANYNNMALTCTCTAVGPVEPTFSACFSETATVLTRDNGVVATKDLRVGEQVMVGRNQKQQPIYETVYSFGHSHETKEAEFLRLFTNLTTGAPLEITPTHLIYKLQQGQKHSSVVRADTVELFDVLIHNGAPAQVNRIERMTLKGLYMPLTPSGSIVVDGVKASAYVSIQDWAPSVVEKFAAAGFSEQMVFHLYLAPYRFACMGLSKQFCRGHDEEGILNYLNQGRRLAEFGEGFGTATQVLLFGPLFVAVFGLFVALEYPLGPSMAPLLLAVFVGLVWYNVNSNRQEKKSAKKTV